MVTLLIITLAVFAIIGIGLYFWQKPKPHAVEYVLPRQPEARSLFADDTSSSEETEQPVITTQVAESLIARAQKGERPALTDARQAGDADLYERVLNELVREADSEAKLLALMSYITQNKFAVNAALAQAVINSWQESPDREGTAKALHFAALSDNANIYQTAVEGALRLWREGRIEHISPPELIALFDGEFWILSSGTRSSGTGFVLKQTLASARRELEAATRAPR